MSDTQSSEQENDSPEIITIQAEEMGKKIKIPGGKEVIIVVNKGTLSLSR